jgi:hypothetical protein
MRQREVEREMPSPGMADRPPTVDARSIEHGDGVCDVRLDRERPVPARRRGAALRVPQGLEQPVERIGAVAQVVRNGGAAVEEERRLARAAAVAVQRAAWDRDLERLRVDRSTLQRPGRAVPLAHARLCQVRP